MPLIYFVLFPSNSEHVKLLNAIEQYGYGNWEDIAKGINSEAEGQTVWRKRTPIGKSILYLKIHPLDGNCLKVK